MPDGYGNPVLHRFAYGVADDLKVRRAEAGAEKMRSFAAFDYAARLVGSSCGIRRWSRGGKKEQGFGLGAQEMRFGHGSDLVSE